MTEEPAFLTTKEVAALLRVKERKVYDLAAAGEIPHRRITGKLLFPAAEIEAWLRGDAKPSTERPAVLTGSHDPLLDWAVRESDCGLAVRVNGSGEGLESYARGEASLAGMHLRGAGGAWNIPAVEAKGLTGAVLIGWAQRRRGLILSADAARDIQSIADLAGRRVARRQPGAGGAALLDALLGEAGLSETDLQPVGELARTEGDAAASVAAGEAEAALGIEAMARRFNLRFLPLLEEPFDLLVDRRAYFLPPLQRLLGFARSEAFARKAEAMGGYDLATLGEVRWVSA